MGFSIKMKNYNKEATGHTLTWYVNQGKDYTGFFENGLMVINERGEVLQQYKQYWSIKKIYEAMRSLSPLKDRT